VTAYKRVLILAANVHDGLGGEYVRGQHPVLPADIADLFITKGLAALESELTPDEAKALAVALEDEKRQTAVKDHAEAVMKRHDALPPEDRAAFQQDEHHIPKPPTDESENVVPMPKRRGRPRKGSA
jgi:hypothetical protein